MKKFIFLALLSSPFLAFSQESDSSKVEQYCELVATGRLLSTKVNIDVNYGEERKFFKTYMLKNADGKMIKFNSVVDGINYLGSQGWKLVNAFPISDGSGNGKIYHFYFKKEFLKADVINGEK
jgi:hypothetical protein